MRSVFREGTALPSEKLDRDDNKIGSGGNGNVFTFRYLGNRYAVKEVMNFDYLFNLMILFYRLNSGHVSFNGGHSLTILVSLHYYQ